MRYALLGRRLAHSYSKIIHELIYKKSNIAASYELYELEIEELEEAINKLRLGIYNGYNVTIPYKEEIMKYLDIIDPNALKIGSVNTVALENGKVVGYNTDYYGFIQELEYYNINPKNKDCYILGTGGAAKALFRALETMGGNTTYVSRNALNKSNTIDYNELKNKHIDLLVNSTPVGMYPNVEECPLASRVEANIAVDIIFNPKATKLLEMYNSKYNGLLMLIGQALKADEIWLRTKLNLSLDDLLKEVEGIVYE